MNDKMQAQIIGGMLVAAATFTYGYIVECRKAKQLKMLNARLRHPAKGKGNLVPELKGLEAHVSELSDRVDALVVRLENWR